MSDSIELYLFDTYSRSIREFKPLNPAKADIYACGPTVYNYAHIGNLRTYVFEDLLRRVLEYNGYQTKHVINITDVGHLVSDADDGEDKMEKGARRIGKTAWEVAELYTRAFKEDLQKLNILEPDIWCKATDHIEEQIEFIEEIEENGYTYRTSDGIYFDTSKLSNYGHLARLNIEGLQAGVRVDMAEKRNVTDFALWKFSSPGPKRQMEWASPWGKGFPGWHIECSAMSSKYLGNFFDIHCGGIDHIPVHHSNEIAQTQANCGTNLANFWMHGDFLQLKEQKMAKSGGKFIRIQTLIDMGYDPVAFRFLCLTAHYRTKLNFSWESLGGAAKTLDRLRKYYVEWGKATLPDNNFLDRFLKLINNDIDMPQVLALTWELVRGDLPSSVKKSTLGEFDKVLGLNLSSWEIADKTIPEEIHTLVNQRQQARKDKDWKVADSIRDKILEAGFIIEDTPEGVEIYPKKSYS